jgi:SagB-type dehydrogenase family enzyme
MSNRNTEAAWAYHNATKHSYWSVRSGGHFLDWANHPLPFKIYPNLEPAKLPQDFEPLAIPALEAISKVGPLTLSSPWGEGTNGEGSQAEGSHRERVPNLKTLAQLLYFSAGITKRRTYPGGEIFFRAAACTGALYSIELYLVTSDLPHLQAGVFHFNPADFALRKLRGGDYRQALVQATASEPSIAHAPVILISTGTYWRNAWKYQARTYRHFGWDNGMIMANLLAVATAFELPARALAGFVDDTVNRLLDLDTEREVALTLVPLGWMQGAVAGASPAIEALGFETIPLSRSQVDYPAMREMHSASAFLSEKEVVAWRGPAERSNFPPPGGKTIALDALSEAEIPRDSVGQVILRRGSTRRFAQKSISFRQLSTMLLRATQGIPADFLDPTGTLLNDLYLIVHAVEGLPPGAYVLHRNPWALELIKKGEFREEAAHLGLDQELPGDASVAVFFLADLEAILKRFGNRGYRAVQLEAGILGGKLYLAAYAQRLGATGLTFYDDDVTEFFSPHARGKSAIFLTALGKPAKQLVSVRKG